MIPIGIPGTFGRQAGEDVSDTMSLIVGGRQFTSFLSLTGTSSVADAARTAQMTVASELGEAATALAFRAGTPFVLNRNDTAFVTGYVDRYQPRFSAREATITVTGRAKGQDAIDSSVVHKTGFFKGRTPLQIASELLQPFGLTASSTGAMTAVPHFQVTPGETVFGALEKLGRDQGYTLRGRPDGSVQFWNAEGVLPRQKGKILEGVNLLSGESDHNFSKRHSHYHVRGQSSHGTSADVMQLESVAKDDAVTRYRPHVHVHDEDTDQPRVRKHAESLRSRRAGRSLSAVIDVVGYVDDGGTPWDDGNLVYVESDFLDLKQDMLIERVSISLDNRGLLTKLHLCDPRTYLGLKRKWSKSGAEWSMSDEDAT